MILRTIIGVAIGAAAGFACFRFVGCASGTCPITSNPYNSTIYGAVMGAFASGLFRGPF
jgi:hypothetical protein